MVVVQTHNYKTEAVFLHVMYRKILLHHQHGVLELSDQVVASLCDRQVIAGRPS